MHIAIGPIGDRMHLEASAGALYQRSVGPRWRLVSAQAHVPGPDVEFAQGTLHRLNLHFLIVGGQAFRIGLPTSAVAGFLPGSGERRAEHLQIQIQALGRVHR